MKKSFSSVSAPKTKSVMDLTQESVHTSDNKDIGDIEAVNKDSIVVKRGFKNVHYYYVPIREVKGWDEHVVWLKIPEGDVIAKYQRTEEPDRSKYFTKEHGYSDVDVRNMNTIDLPNIAVISNR